ncbi:MAG: alcohol dehydrogenase catalytic domain-containing protein, partial [Actinobacteria bacterium]|nr:alcohol dehydrogenase catalytic domain-containing protein [Actinomycetota bacterium]
MRAFTVQELGKPGSVQEVPDLVPGEGEVLIRVKAASVNPWDVIVMNGYVAEMMEHRLPLTPGTDLSGEIVEAPDGSGFSPGDQVYGIVLKPFQGEGSWA